jgi:hypothetical protein
MPATRIDSYLVQYSSNTFYRRIGLLSGSAYIGQLVFMPDGTALAADKLSGTQPQLYYHLKDFANCIDLLRNEKPVYLLWNGPGNENGLRTGEEPAGEGE